MKRLFLIIAFILSVALLSASAHSGGTDSKGGHYDRSTGKYHYHHGYSAHQHPDGKCPYDFKDVTTPQPNRYRSYSRSTPTPVPTAPPDSSSSDDNLFSKIILGVGACCGALRAAKALFTNS